MVERITSLITFSALIASSLSHAADGGPCEPCGSVTTRGTCVDWQVHRCDNSGCLQVETCSADSHCDEFEPGLGFECVPDVGYDCYGGPCFWPGSVCDDRTMVCQYNGTTPCVPCGAVTFFGECAHNRITYCQNNCLRYMYCGRYNNCGVVNDTWGYDCQGIPGALCNMTDPGMTCDLSLGTCNSGTGRCEAYDGGAPVLDAGAADNASPDTAQPDTAVSDSALPDTAQPDSQPSLDAFVAFDSASPQDSALTPDSHVVIDAATGPDRAAVTPDSSIADVTAINDTSRPDSAVSDTSPGADMVVIYDATALDTSTPPDASAADANAPDTVQMDAGAADSGVQSGDSAMVIDAAERDADTVPTDAQLGDSSANDRAPLGDSATLVDVGAQGDVQALTDGPTSDAVVLPADAGDIEQIVEPGCACASGVVPGISPLALALMLFALRRRWGKRSLGH